MKDFMDEGIISCLQKKTLPEAILAFDALMMKRGIYQMDQMLMEEFKRMEAKEKQDGTP